MGYHLPSYEQAKFCTTEKYLIGIINEEIYCPNLNDIDKPVITHLNITRVDIYDEIIKLLGKDVGLDPFHLPKK